MKPVLIAQNCPDESPGLFRDYLDLHNIEYLKILTYTGEDFPPLESVSAFFNLGCPLSVTRYQERDYLKNLYGKVAEAARTDLPYIGVCFGGQLLARVMGARVQKNHKKEIGTYNVTLTEEGAADPIFAGLSNDLTVFQWHQDTFDIPVGAKLLATAEDCNNQAFVKGRMYALQFHLEADPYEIPQWCEVYQSELDEEKLTASDVIDKYRAMADSVRKDCFTMLDNFFGKVVGK